MNKWHQIIKLQVRLDSGNQWKFVWEDPLYVNRAIYYHVSASMVKEMSRCVREALKTFVEAALSAQPLAMPLRAVAEAGSLLREAIFTAEGQGGEAAARARELVANRAGSMILVNAENKVYIPWGLIFDGEVHALPTGNDDISQSHYSDFWCLKYLTTTLYDGIDPSPIERPRSAAEAKVIAVANGSCWDPAWKAGLETDRELFESVWGKDRLPLTTSEHLFKEWKSACREVDLLYFYCHATGSMLELSADDKIEMDRFRLRMKRDVNHPICLVFLNGCQTAIGHEDGGFLEVTGRTGYCGFIGTETVVPDLFALRFATDFLWRLFTLEKPVIEVLDQLRKDHWPLSLIYCAACHPFFRFRNAEAASPEVKVQNFSQGRILVEKRL